MSGSQRDALFKELRILASEVMYKGCPMRSFFIYTILLIGITGCTPQLFKGMKSGTKQNILKENLYPFFDNRGDSTHIFNMQISYKSNDVDGFLIVKHNAEGATRAVYTSIPGITIFDFEFSATEFDVHRCIEPMRKKIVLNLFEKDFRTLFLYNVPASFNAKTYQSDNSTVGYKIKTDNGKAYFVTDTNRKELQKVQLPGFITLLNIDYKDFEDDFPKHISIAHPKIKLKMQLTRTK